LNKLLTKEKKGAKKVLKINRNLRLEYFFFHILFSEIVFRIIIEHNKIKLSFV